LHTDYGDVVKELQKFCENILKKREGFELGEPWKFSDKSMGVIVPILRGGEYKRDYITLPETEKVDFEDKGGISPIGVKNTGGLPLFIRSGSVLQGISGQDRAVIHSMILDPKVDIDIKVRCVHASRPTSHGGKFKYSGIAPRVVQSSLRKSQHDTWNSVQSYFCMSSMVGSDFQSGKTKSMRMGRRRSPVYGATIGATIGESAVKHDDLPSIQKKQKELDGNLQDILKQVPVLENQIGAIIVGMSGVIGVESFDHPESWKAQYKDAISNYSDELAEKAEKSLFKFDDSKVMEVIEEFLTSISKVEPKPIDKGGYILQMKGYLGEVSIHMGHVVHMFLMQTDDDEQPDFSNRQPRMRTATIGLDSERADDVIIGSARANFFYEPETLTPRYKTKSFNDMGKLLSVSSKKGIRKVTSAINDQGGQASWKDIEQSLGSDLSTATISARLKDGKDAGIIGEKIRHKNGKKVYTFKKRKCNLCHLGKCDPDVDFHIGEYYLE